MSFKKIFSFIIGLSAALAYAQTAITAPGSIQEGWQSIAQNDVIILGYDNWWWRADSASSGKNFFIPSRTAAEWNAVTSHPPAGLTLTPCLCAPSTVESPSAACPIANGSGSRQCWSNGASWSACNYTCNAGFTMTAGVCVANITYAYYWRSYMPAPYFEAFTDPAIPSETQWYLLDEFCDKEIVGASPYNAGAVNEPDPSLCVAYDRPKNPTRCSWLDYTTQTTMIWQCR